MMYSLRLPAFVRWSALAVACLFLASCSKPKTISGTYTTGAHTFTFNGDHVQIFTASTHTTEDCTYVVKGNEIIVTTGGALYPLHIDDDGSLKDANGEKMVKK